MKSILDKSFRYTCAAETNIARTFARIRRAQAKTREQRKQEASANTERVLDIFAARRKEQA